MSTEALRRQILTDRLESVELSAERWQLEAYEAGAVDEATRWFEYASMVRATIQLVHQRAAGGPHARPDHPPAQ